MRCHVVIAGSPKFRKSTQRALQLARGCTFGKRLCEAKVVLCESWLYGFRFLYRHRVEVIPKNTWKLSDIEYAGVLARILALRLLYQLKNSSRYIWLVENTAEAVEAASLDDLGADEHSKRAAINRFRSYIGPRLVTAGRQERRRRWLHRLCRRLPVAFARRDVRVLAGIKRQATIFSVNIVGSPYFVARNKRALETLAQTASVFIADVTTRVRTIREASSLRDTPFFALVGLNNEELHVNWSEIRNGYHPIQYAALLAWHSRDPAETSRLAGDAEDGPSIAELRFMREVCQEAGASARLLDHIDFQLRHYYDQEP